MREFLKNLLICPICLPDEIPLNLQIFESEKDDIREGVLKCTHCGAEYKIKDGIAILPPDPNWIPSLSNKYENIKVVSSYLWSHFGDWLGDSEWIDAYKKWTELINPDKGLSLDIGCAVGRFTIEIAQKSEFSVGIDLSMSFIKTARELINNRMLTFPLFEEGNLAKQVEVKIPETIKTENVDFIVADALNLPFRKDYFSIVSSLNILDKVPKPMKHLLEMNRVAKKRDAQMLISDPYSWSEDVAKIDDWLGGKEEGEFQGFGIENVLKILEGYKNLLNPTWKIITTGSVYWKIRNHRNHSELITSLFVKAVR